MPKSKDDGAREGGPPGKSEERTIHSKTRGTTEPLVNESGLKTRQLADQLKTVFVAGLLSLWAAELRSGVSVPPPRESWWHFVFVSALVLVLYLVWGRKKIPRPWRWVFLCGMLGYLWLFYYISGILVSIWFPRGLAIFLFAWTLFLLFAIVPTMYGPWGERKLGKVVTRVVKQGDSFMLLLSFFVLFTSILLGLGRLSNAGERGWWMDALLILGMIVIISYVVIYPVYHRASRSGGES